MATEAERKAAAEAFAAAHEIPIEEVDALAERQAFNAAQAAGASKIEAGREKARREMEVSARKTSPDDPFAKLRTA